MNKIAMGVLLCTIGRDMGTCVTQTKPSKILNLGNIWRIWVHPCDPQAGHNSQKGCRSEAVNFRPISLTSHIIKTFERVIRKTLFNFLEFNKKMDFSQHGSRAGRFILSQLLQHQDADFKALEEGENIQKQSISQKTMKRWLYTSLHWGIRVQLLNDANT